MGACKHVVFISLMNGRLIDGLVCLGCQPFKSSVIQDEGARDEAMSFQALLMWEQKLGEAWEQG